MSLEFKKINETIDLFQKYKDVPEAQLTLYPDVIDKFSDYICHHIYETYFSNDEVVSGHIMARCDYLKDENLIIYAEDTSFKNKPYVRIYSKYNFKTFDLEILIIESDTFNALLDWD